MPQPGVSHRIVLSSGAFFFLPLPASAIGSSSSPPPLLLSLRLFPGAFFLALWQERHCRDAQHACGGGGVRGISGKSHQHTEYFRDMCLHMLNGEEGRPSTRDNEGYSDCPERECADLFLWILDMGRVRMKKASNKRYCGG